MSVELHPLHRIMEEDAERILNMFDHFSTFDNKHVLLTGSTGLIGLNFLVLFNLLIKRGCNLRVTAAANKGRVPLLDHFDFDHSRIRFARGDLSNNVNFLAGEYDCLIHAASYGQPNKFMADTIRTLKLNSETFFDLVELVRPSGDILFISSSEVYNGCTVIPHKESDVGIANTDHPRACYIEGKRFGEVVVNSLRSQGFNAVASRLGMTYGPGTRQDDQRVLQQIIKRGIDDKVIRLLDDGMASRSFCYTMDSVDIMLRMIKQGKQWVYNCAGDYCTTIRHMAEIIGNHMNLEVIVPESGCGSKGAPPAVNLDLSLVKSDLGKYDFLPFELGIRRTVEWQRILHST